MAQVHNRVNAGIMDAVTCGGMCEAAEPEDEEYEIGLEEGGFEPYAHVVKESGEDEVETYYRGFNSELGEQKTHLIWLTSNIEYAKAYGDKVVEYKVNAYDDGIVDVLDLPDEVDYYQGPDQRTCKMLLRKGIKGYAFDADNDSETIVLWDKSPIVSKKVIISPTPINESSDCIPYYNLVLGMDNAYPFITFTKKDGTDTETFVGEPGGEHNAMPVKLLSDKKIKREDFGNSLWDIKRDEYRSGRIWFLENGRIFVSFYSYKRSNYSAMYKDVAETLLQVKEKLGLNFNIGKVIIDFWTFVNGDDNIFVPVRWLNNGVADTYFQYMKECVPVGEDSFKLKTTKGKFVLDWKGNDIEERHEILKENIERGRKNEYEKCIKSIINFFRKQHLVIDPLPKIELNNEEQEGLFIRTGYYDPTEKKVVVFINQRHIKDCLRTVCHEFVHHMQNLQDPGKDWGSNGDLEADSKLRSIEGEAFLLGNIIFREWTEYAKKNERNLNESRLSESPDSIYNKDLFYRDEEAVPFMLSKEDGEFYVGYGGQTHIEMMAEYFAKDRGELYNAIDEDTFGDYVDVESTGRYWPEENIISFWKTPLDHKKKLLNVISRLSSYTSFDFKHLVIDWWDNNSHYDSEIPYRWLINDTFYMFYDKGIQKITRNSNDVFTIIMRDGQRYNFDYDGNFIEPEYSYAYSELDETTDKESKKRKKQVRNDEGELVPETCDKCGGKIVCQIHGEPVYICKECGKYFGTMPFPDNLNEITSELVEPDDVDLSSFNIKKHLNPKFWDDGHLDTRIRLKLLDIADDFFDSLGVDWVEPEDVIITGSLANYNWNDKYSDIDLHILVDYEDVDERVDFVREYFMLKKNEWNEKHKGLRIFGFPVEVYVQDANEAHASSGVYSIDRDEWITEPDREKIRSGKVDKKHIREMISTYMNKIDCLIDIYKHHKDDKHEMEHVAKDAAEILDEIKAVRKKDLAKYGREMCDGNIIFKALRRADYIGKLIKLKNLAYDKINSL